MRAVILTPDHEVRPAEVPAPDVPAPEHVIVRMAACGINSGDRYFIPFGAPGVWGASGAGTVVAVGGAVPRPMLGRTVAVYRSLRPGPGIVATACERAELHHLSCLPLPDGADPLDYCGSLVNAVTTYGFWEQAARAGHRGAIITAPTAATGRAMLGLARERGIPVLLLARDAAARARLAAGPEPVLCRDDPGFGPALAAAAEELGTTAVFDGVGGDLLDRLLSHLPVGSAIFHFGNLSGAPGITLSTGPLRLRAVTLYGFSNFRTDTVRDPVRLQHALSDLAAIIDRPEFRTTPAPTFPLHEVDRALSSERAILLSQA